MDDILVILRRRCASQADYEALLTELEGSFTALANRSAREMFATLRRLQGLPEPAKRPEPRAPILDMLEREEDKL